MLYREQCMQTDMFTLLSLRLVCLVLFCDIITKMLDAGYLVELYDHA